MKEAIIQYNDTPSGGYMAISLKPLIRCKDCKHGFRLDDTNYIVCGRPFASNRETHTEKWFCADGERREYVKPPTESATDWDGVECE